MAAKVDHATIHDSLHAERGAGLAPLVPVEPFVDHGMSQRFRFRTIAVYDLSGHFNVARMNGNDPLIPFDQGADGVSYTSVFHQGTLRSN